MRFSRCMMTCPRNAYLSSKLVSGVKGAWLRRFSLFLGNNLPAGQVALQLPKHNTRPCMSGLDAAAFVSRSVPRCSKKSWKTLSQRASLGFFHFLHRCGGDCCVSLMLGFPPFHCALLIMCPIDMAGLMMPVFPLESTSTETNPYYSL